MSYATELVNSQYKGNVVVRINGGAYYARHQPDSGLSVPAAQRILGKFKINPQVISIEDARTTFGTVSFSLVDLDGIVTALFAGNYNLFMRQEVEIWLGFVGNSFAWADYVKLQRFNISSVNYKAGEYSFDAQEITANFKKAIFNTQALLAGDHSAGASSIVAGTDISDFPASGRLFLENEFLDYTSKNDGTKTFTLSGVTTDDHLDGAEAFNVYTVTNENPIDILLRILQSTGGGTYDDYPEGLAVEDADIDITAIEAIRAANYSGELFSFEIYGIENILAFIEKEILKTCSLRFIINANNKLSLTVLDTSIFGAATREFTEDNLDPAGVTYSVDDTSVRNVVEFKWGYDYTSGNFTKTLSVEDAESIANYGRRDPFIIESKGTPDTPAGLDLATDRVTRWLARLSTATPQIGITSFFSQSLTLVGERVILTYPLPTAAGDRLFSKELEVIKKDIDEEKGTLKLGLAVTNYSGLREAFISPSEEVLTYNPLTDTYTVSGDVTSRWNVDDKIRIWIQGLGPLYVQPYQTIQSITYSAPNTSIIATPTIVWPLAAIEAGRIQFADYSEITRAQQRRYAFVSDGTANFSDGTPPYQITF